MPAPHSVMLFAAGLGRRMAPLTDSCPKPLIKVTGRPLIDHALALCHDAQLTQIVVNIHHLAPLMRRHLAHYPNIAVSHETNLLETGGGLRAALPLLGTDPVVALNSDAVWTRQNPLVQLMNAWQPDHMDCLLLLLPAAQATGFTHKGDFMLAPDGRIARANGQDAYAYLGAQILKTDGLADIDKPVFSLNMIWDRAIHNRRAYGIVHQGGWCDVGRPENIALAEALLSHV